MYSCPLRAWVCASGQGGHEDHCSRDALTGRELALSGRRARGTSAYGEAVQLEQRHARERAAPSHVRSTALCADDQHYNCALMLYNCGCISFVCCRVAHRPFPSTVPRPPGRSACSTHHSTKLRVRVIAPWHGMPCACARFHPPRFLILHFLTNEQ